MSRTRTAALLFSISFSLFLAAAASAQVPTSFGGGSLLGNKPQEDIAVAPAPAVSPLGSLFTGDALSLRRWFLEFSARPVARPSAVRSTPAQRSLVKRDRVWVQ